jgi:hypothetical protein
MLMMMRQDKEVEDEEVCLLKVGFEVKQKKREREDVSSAPVLDNNESTQSSSVAFRI